jgi:hypothetical protein
MACHHRHMSEPPKIQFSVIWPDVEDLTVYACNQFLVQISAGSDGRPEDLILTLGFIAPPVILGTPEEQQASAMALQAVSVKGVSRVSMSRGNAEQLMNLIGAQLAATGYGQSDQA